MEASKTLLGLGGEWWIAIATFFLAAVTLLLVGVGLHQIRKIREENKKSATLAVCTNYESNPVIYGALQELWKAKLSGDLERHPELYRTHLVMLLNYLDGIAIGIDQGLYIEDLAWDHMEGIVGAHVDRYIDSGIILKVGLTRQNFRCLIALRDRWSQARPRFEDVP